MLAGVREPRNLVVSSIHEARLGAAHSECLGATVSPLQLEGKALFVHDSCMGKTITIADDVYQLLSSLKQGAGDSFTKPGNCRGSGGC